MLQVDLLERDFNSSMKTNLLKDVLSYRHLFQYMLDPVHELLRVDKAWEVHCMDDAFTMSIKTLVSAKATNIVINSHP